MTNFEKITENPETLAEHITQNDNCDMCDLDNSGRCKGDHCGIGGFRWLNEESEE